MKTQLKKIVSRSIPLYYVWFKLIRKRKGLDVQFFNRDTDIYIDAYPRSGNTFTIHLMKNLLPQINVVHHLHVVAAIKIAFWLDLPVFIIIRDPMECISSKYLKHFSMRGLEVDTSTIDESLVSRFISDYLIYYKFVKRNSEKISIIDFNQLINQPKIVVNNIKNHLEIEEEFTQDEVSHVIQSYKGATNTMGSSRPNPKKEKYKSVIKKYIAQSKRHSDILKLYHSIVNNG